MGGTGWWLETNTLKRQHYFCSLNSEVLVLQFSPRITVHVCNCWNATDPTRGAGVKLPWHTKTRVLSNKTKTKQKRRLQEAAVSQCRAGTGEGEAVLGREAELGQGGRSQRRQYPQLYACQTLLLLHWRPPSLMRHWVQKARPSLPLRRPVLAFAGACTRHCPTQRCCSGSVEHLKESWPVGRRCSCCREGERENDLIRWMWFWGGICNHTSIIAGSLKSKWWEIEAASMVTIRGSFFSLLFTALRVPGIGNVGQRRNLCMWNQRYYSCYY